MCVFPDTSGKGSGMDDLINQIKRGGVKLKSTKSYSTGGPSKKADNEEKEKPADAVQEMKSILATMKRGRHGRLKPSEISQGSKFRTKVKNEESDSQKGIKTETPSVRTEDPSCTVTNGNVASQSKGNTHITNTTQHSTADTNQTVAQGGKEEETDKYNDSVYRGGSSVEECFPSKEVSVTPSLDTDTTASASYTLRLTCPSAGEDECSSREATPPNPGPRTSEEQEGIRPSSGRAVTTTTIFLRNSQSPAQD